MDRDPDDPVCWTFLGRYTYECSALPFWGFTAIFQFQVESPMMVTCQSSVLMVGFRVGVG